MKTKDALMLEEAYLKVLKENESEYVTSWKEDPLGLKDGSMESEDIPSDDKFSKLEIGLGRSNPSVEQADLLQGLSKDEAEELLNHLNEKGEEDDSNWVLKDNLIRQLFDLLKNPNI
jgi:hypothetical protein